ncbi:GTPase subunit of restriction endonuclease [Flavimobilis marinus]|uniref:5-methylcytosine-specific restriction enzyme B n=1 Tax=Flavimobilis marinus TaxID=285351 RepID=A0A1I2G1W7_9MICO|nr:AAA family ATPase [Flavimobilis marinus]GHG50465.1 GTPase subunit of restriction endonuclease [Flavimobilis marinus]SFF11119.1 5-methylcytosine-specific restriction enzyme B [Flavimobilis marinus]
MPDSNARQSIRRPLLLGTALRILRDSTDPVPSAEVVRRIADDMALTEHELSRNKTGIPRYETGVRFEVSHARQIGWLTPGGSGWALTDAGRAALAGAESDDALLATLNRERRTLLASQAQPRAGSADTPASRLGPLRPALDQLGPGQWTSFQDLAQLTGLPYQDVAGRLMSSTHPATHRVLTLEGTVSEDFRWPDPARTDDAVNVLHEEGVEFDAHGRANQAARVTSYDLRELLAETTSSSTRRAWLVRGNNVNGKNLVPTWLGRGSVSVAASQIRSLDLPLTRAEIVGVVEEDYAQKSYNTRNEKVTELDLFINRIQVGDLVLVNDGGSFYLGDITGEVTSVRSSDDRSNLRRDVTWRNAERPVDLTDLPAALKPKLSSQHTVIDLTSELAALAGLVATGVEEETKAAKTAPAELVLRPATDDLAERLLVDRAWVQSCIDLLRDRRQIVFYGPPGTGKTYLAQEIAHHLTDDSAVKLVQFHPAYSYEDFFEGYRPVAPKDGSATVGFTLTPGPFRRLVDAARENPSTPYVLIVDEINRANLAKVFGELYFLLEYRDRAIDLLYSTGDEAGFTMPSNVFIIGTMNTADRSIALVDAAMRRRFAFKALHPSVEPTRSMLRRWLDRMGLPATTADVLDHLNALITDEDFRIGPSYFMRDDVHRDGGLETAWETAILPLLEEHHFGEGLDVAGRYSLPKITARVARAAGPAEVPEPEQAADEAADPVP